MKIRIKINFDTTYNLNTTYKMYICHSTEPNGLVWFNAIGRSMYEVAYLYQTKQITKADLKPDDRRLLVRFNNYLDYKLVLGEKYFLHLGQGANHQRIEIAFDSASYVADHFRMEISEIHQSTWDDIFEAKVSLEPDFDFTSDREFGQSGMKTPKEPEEFYTPDEVDLNPDFVAEFEYPEDLPEDYQEATTS